LVGKNGGVIPKEIKLAGKEVKTPINEPGKKYSPDQVLKKGSRSNNNWGGEGGGR